MIKLPVDDQDEVEYSRWIMRLFQRSADMDAAMTPLLTPNEGAPLCGDDKRIPHYPVSGYAAGQLAVATGCIASLRQMMVSESETKVDMLASPFGAYTLVRNSMDAAAVALWLLEPVNGTLRIKRRVMLGVDEISKSSDFWEASGRQSFKEKRRTRMQEVADLAGLLGWNPLSKNAKLPSTTQMLRELERWHDNVVMPWLAAWQLASGHAHGKLWSHIASHELQEVEGTRTDTGAHFQMTIRYGMLAAVLFEAVQLLETAGNRYTELALTSKSI